MISRFPKSLLLSLSLMALIFMSLASVSQKVQAQSLFSSKGDTSEERAEIPEDLTPELIDQLLARLSDEQLRELFHQELIRQAEVKEQEAIVTGQLLVSIEARLSEMAITIDARVTRWSGAIANLGSRGPKVDERLALAQNGILGMILAAVALIAAGLLSALAVARSTRGWRTWLTSTKSCGYWEKVIRTAALGVLELLPIAGFLAVTRIFAPFLDGQLGPLNGMVWIYYIGVSYSWAFIIIARRAFAPDAPQIRIAPLKDGAAISTHELLQRAVFIGAGGWLIAGLFPNFGLGFPPALITVAVAGTAVAAVLLLALVRNFDQVRSASADILNREEKSTAFIRILVSAAPVLLVCYILCAWLYWLAHWLERGQHRLEGPVGTLIVFFALPIFDRLGQEIVRSLLNKDSDVTERFRTVFHGAWRALISIVAILVVADLWGLDLLALAKGAEAPVWTNTGFDIMVTLLIGFLIWRMIGAALYSEKRVSSAAEDADPVDAPEASRLDTLTPLFRNMLLGFLGVIVIMSVLSALGVDIAPLIASAGVVGIAVGFGAQTLVKDIFSGIFFLVDDAFRVGEYIELDKQTRGEVESISIRSLQLRHHRGSVITIPFGELKKITNHNRDWVIYKMPFRLEPDTDPKHVKKVVKAVGKEFLKHPEHGPKFLEPLKSQGILSIDDDSALIMRVKFKCKPRAQFVLRREIYHKLRTVFAEEGIHFARRKVEVVGPDGGKVENPSAVALPPEVLAPETSST